MSGSGSLLFKFLARVGGPKVQEIAQRYTHQSQFVQSRKEAFDVLAKEFPSAMQSNDQDVIHRLLNVGKIASELHQKESRIYMSNLQAKLEELEKSKKDKKTPPFN